MSFLATIKRRWGLFAGLLLVIVLLAALGFCSLVWNGVEALVAAAQG